MRQHLLNSTFVTKGKPYIRPIELSQVVKHGKARAVRLRKAIVKTLERKRRSLKKTFSKKRNQRRATYVIGAIMIVSLLFGIWGVKTQAHQEKQQLHQTIEQVEHLQEEKKVELQSVSKALEELKEEKAVTDTQLQEKAAREAEMKAQIDKLNADLQAKAAAEARIATAPVRGGMGGSSVATSEGNTYSYGYCTWYVANRRPDIPNTWGNANTWYARAQASEWPTGTVPKIGAIGQNTTPPLGHVVYVEAVYADGTILISEMNFAGWNVQSSRTVSPTEFNYIY